MKFEWNLKKWSEEIMKEAYFVILLAIFSVINILSNFSVVDDFDTIAILTKSTWHWSVFNAAKALINWNFKTFYNFLSFLSIISRNTFSRRKLLLALFTLMKMMRKFSTKMKVQHWKCLLKWHHQQVQQLK